MHMEELLSAILTSEDPRIRRESAEALITDHAADHPEVVETLVTGLSDPDKGVRDMCAQGLAASSENSLFKAQQVAPLIRHQDIEIRNLAGDTLIRLGEAGAQALLPYCADPDPDHQKYACDIIGLVGTADMFEHVVPLLDAKDLNVKCAGIEALGNLSIGDSVPMLMKQYEEFEDIRPYVIEALGKISTKDSQNFLVKCLREEDEFIQVMCIDALAGSANDIDIAYKLMQLIPDAEEQLQLILLKTVIGIAFRLEQDIVLPHELRYVGHAALGDDDPDIRIAGLLALGSEYSLDDVSALISHYNNDDEQSKARVVSVGLCGSDADVVRSLFRSLLIANADNQNALIELLGFVHEVLGEAPEDNVSAFIDMLGRTKNELSVEAVDIFDFLGSVSPEKALEVLVGDLESGDPNRVHEALLITSHFGVVDVLPQVEAIAATGAPIADTAATIAKELKGE